MCQKSIMFQRWSAVDTTVMGITPVMAAHHAADVVTSRFDTQVRVILERAESRGLDRVAGDKAGSGVRVSSRSGQKFQSDGTQ
jgi:hypothetical protein